MLEPAENQELALLMSINQRNPRHHTHNHVQRHRVCYLALTFGTLLSSQRADAQELDPHGRRPWRLVLLYAVHGSLSHPEV